MSLLPGMAASTRVSIPEAGAYISAYAVGVVVGAPLIAVCAARWARKILLFALLALALVGYIGSAMAWDSISLLVARFISGLPHGAFYGVASLVAAAMVPECRKARAIGFVMLGLAAANVVGVPLATWIGQDWGWRAAFFAVAIGCVFTAIMMHFFVPSVATNAESSPASELQGLKRPMVWLTLAIASIGFGGMFAVYSYITPTLTEVAGFSEQQVPLALAIWGLGMVFGNLVGGWLADCALVPSIFGMLAWNAIFLGLFSIAVSSRPLTFVVLFLIGNGFALVPALQARLMKVAGSAQTLAATLNHSAFNISNAVGATLGGLAIARGMGWAATGWVGSALAIGGLGLMVLSTFRVKSTLRSSDKRVRRGCVITEGASPTD
ncbi:MFS transporter [Cupriavidus pinatubonensis]|uniref:MFS transporter n=1 Tax=Cupriavidus pinatubonensis TaxID=248026 RepID=UPI003CC8C4EE